MKLEQGKRLAAAILTSTFCVVPLYVMLSALSGDLVNDLLSFVLMVASIVALVFRRIALGKDQTK